MNQFFIFGAKYLFLVSGLIFAVYFLKSKEKREFLIISISIPITYVFGLLARTLYDNPRPFLIENFKPMIDHVADNGFPSDHVLLVSALAGVVTLFNKKIGLFMWLLAIIVAISRVYTGVHHVLDVVASILISIIALGMIYFLNKKQKHGTTNAITSK